MSLDVLVGIAERAQLGWHGRERQEVDPGRERRDHQRAASRQQPIHNSVRTGMDMTE